MVLSVLSSRLPYHHPPRGNREQTGGTGGARGRARGGAGGAPAGGGTSWLAYYERGDRYGFWAAIDKGTGAFLGWFHLRPLPEDPDDEPELGYRLNAAAWGQGYATEGSRALIRKAFEAFGARRVHAATMAVNVGSWRVMEKAGMRFVRTFHYDPHDRTENEEPGDVEYAVTRDEWLAGRTPGPAGEASSA